MTSTTLGTNTLVQVGLVVRDIEATAKAWAELLGLPVPPIIVTDTLELAHTEYQGQPSSARAKLAFLKLGQVALELIEPLGEPSTWHDQLASHGESLHHLAFVVQGLSERLPALAAAGLPVVQRGEYRGGRYVYLDAEERLGAVVELLEND
jgi:catechol 2,3-dioxygenase-like lactoylglutathione lyase family enzyme